MRPATSLAVIFFVFDLSRAIVIVRLVLPGAGASAFQGLSTRQWFRVRFGSTAGDFSR
jgi:hypothetical protein